LKDKGEVPDVLPIAKAFQGDGGKAINNDERQSSHQTAIRQKSRRKSS
jgi:hypothetical protein